MKSDKLKELKKIIPYRWKVQSFSKDQTKCSCVAYIDARDVMDLLDDVCGADGWQDEYYQVKNSLFCKLSIKVGDEWLSKSDCGAETSNEFLGSEAKVKGEPSDAFKRTAVKWGVGRFLYNLDIKWLNCKNKKPVDDNGNIIWDLTKHFNGTQPNKAGANKPSNLNALNLLKTKLHKLGANSDEEACKIITDKTGIVINTMQEVNEQKAKSILEFFNE